MKDIILEKIKHLLKSNQCFNEMIETNNEIKILKSEYMGSSTIETKEIIAIYEILEKYKENLEKKSLENGVIVKFREKS